MSNKSHGTVPTIKQDRGLIEALIANAPVLSAADTQYYIRHQGELKRFLSGLQRGTVSTSDIIRQWQTFYAKYFDFDLTLDLATVAIPTRDGFDRTIIVAEGLTMNRVFEVCKSKFPSWKSHDDLDKAVPTNDRTPTNGSYAIACRDRVEADEELQNFSAGDLEGKGTKTMTLLERMVLELKYFDETGRHLDQKNVTLCAGSRNAGGRVPCADWSGRFYVNANDYGALDRHPYLRAREVAVSDPSGTL